MSLVSYLLSALYYVALLVTCLILASYVYLKYVYRYWARQGIQYLEASYPFGNIKECFDGKSHISHVFEGLYNQIKTSYTGLYFVNNPVVFIKDPNLVQHVLVKDFKSFYDRGVHSDVVNDPLSGHLFRLNGQKWRNLRNKVSPTFTSGKLKMMFSLLIKSGEQLQETVEPLALTEQILNVRDVCSRYTIDVIGSAAFGLEENSFKNPDNDIRNFTMKFVEQSGTYFASIMTNLSMTAPKLMKLLQLKNFTPEITEFLFNILRNVINFRETNKIVRKDFLQLMIQLRNTGQVSEDNTAGDASVYEQKNKVHSLTFEEIAAQSFVFILAGYETSAATMTFCLYELANNPDIQQRVQKDIDDVLAKFGHEFSYESVSEMAYLDMAISETLRKYPPLGFLNRITAEDYTIPDSDNKIIKKGTQIIISVTGLHYDPKYFPNPSKFDPDRFSMENTEKIEPFTYLPFGDGPRICIDIHARYDSDWWSGADDQELEDEKHDAEILKAVQDSVRDWAAKHNRTRYKRAEPNICYPELGCFGSSGAFSYLDTLPSPPEEISTTFLLYPGRRTTRSVTLGNSPLVEVPFNNITDAFEWASKHFNASKPTKVLVHGFGSSCHYVWVYEMRSALMSVDDFNIVCVDWENGAVLPNYVKAAANTRLVGKQLAMLLRGLEEKVGLSRNTMHLIGFSLGAHVAGFAGSELRNISRITGLDPAGPLFETQLPEARLDSTDATFVDVIHSNGENLFLGGLGSWAPMGHVDFYPNGGRMQKGCSNLFVGAVSDFIWSTEVEGRSLCNHRRAYKFFLDSVSSRCHFPAYPCESYDAFLAGKCFPCTAERKCGNMGYFADKSLGRGQLFLITRDEEPFCAHQYNVKIESSTMAKPITNYGKISITLVGDSDLNETFTMTSKDDEKLLHGETFSRILVPHPIISEPTKVEILYRGYSGWLSSGLKRWKIDKVSMMDSFGKTSSVCKKGLELESSIPVLLRLYPGDCNIPKDGQPIDQKPFIEERSDSSPKSSSKNSSSNYPTGFGILQESNRKFIPTPVVRIGNEAIKDEVKTAQKEESISLDEKAKTKNNFLIPWKTYPTYQGTRDDNIVDESIEIETNRAFNTKPAITLNDQFELREISEPILRKPSNKNARSHDLSKPEITEPILGPTTTKTIGTTTSKYQPTLISRLLGERELNYNFYETDWVPSENSRKPQDGKYLKRSDISQEQADQPKEEKEESTNPIRMIMMTVQFLPQRLSRMFEQAEKYARETIFPLITQHTPKFISNIINPKEKQQPQYVPLEYVDPTTPKSNQAKHIIKTDFSPPDVPVSLSRTDLDLNNSTTNLTKANDQTEQVNEARSSFTSEFTTEKVSIIYPDNYNTRITSVDQMDKNKIVKEPPIENTTEDMKEKKIDFSRIPPDSKVYYAETTTEKTEVTSTEAVNRRIIVDLPVFDERDIGVKYIPLIYPDTLKSSEKIT